MKHCLITGASGFLGRYIQESVSTTYSIDTLGRNQASVVCDLGVAIPSLEKSYDLVVHVAGLAHFVPKTQSEKEAFFKVNYQGTKNLVDGLLKANFKGRFVFISTVAVYGKDTGEGIDEGSPLSGLTPYAQSKIRAEEYLQESAPNHGFQLTILRLPLIVGKSAPGNLGTMISSIEKGKYVSIAGGKARKSMVLAQDVAELIASDQLKDGVFNLTDGQHPTFSSLESIITKHFGKSRPKNIPMWAATLLGLFGDLLGSKFPVNTASIKKITSHLTFDDAKARRRMLWKPRKVENSSTLWL